MTNEFKAHVNVIKGVSPATYYTPYVLMSDGAVQWAGESVTSEDAAWTVANRKAKSYNEADV